MKAHPQAGAEIVEQVDGLSPVVEWIRHSHEHVDGSGYPDGLEGRDIPLASRMLLVAEAYDAIPYNGYILWKNGVNVSINSDSDERMRRLNLDAAKMEKYGGVPEQDALQMITLNPAKQLGIDKRTGSIDAGKDADIVIWTAHPFSVYSRVDTTMIDGDVYFDRAKDTQMRADMEKERLALEQLDVNKAPSSGGTPPRIPAEHRQAERDDAGYGDGGNH